MHRLIFSAILFFMAAACNDEPRKAETETAFKKPVNYAEDRDFLRSKDSGLIELKIGNSAVLVSPKYQAKVFTSTAEGEQGKSFGWINYSAFEGAHDEHMNAYGGENRFWLGPEGGKYSLYFKKGDSMVFDNWKTPAPIDTEAWNVLTIDDSNVVMTKDMQLSNYTGHSLSMHVSRAITIENRSDIEQTLSIKLGDSVNYTGYRTENIITNSGTGQWDETTGMPCIWILDMFNPSDATTIVIPFKKSNANAKVATTDYFGEIGGDRLKIKDDVIFFRADGKKRGKMGVLPSFVEPVAGSYDADNNVLTITWFSIDNNGRYLNQVWNTSSHVFSGDAMNAYNDGPLADGSQMGPFYEIESVSPAAALKPDEKISHAHNVYHFTGNKTQLDQIAQRVLGASLTEIEQIFLKN